MEKRAGRYKRKGREAELAVKEKVLAYSPRQQTGFLGLPYASFEIENFRCLQELVIGPLEQVNLITGLNNVGKTSLLEALFLHMGATNPELALRIDRLRGLGILTEMTETPWRTLFWQGQDRAPIKMIAKDFRGHQRKLLITVTPSPSAIHEEKMEKAESEILATLGQEIIFDYMDETKKSHKIIGTPVVAKKDDMVRFQLKMKPSPLPPPFPGIFLTSRHQGGLEEEVQRFSDLRIKHQDAFIVEALRFIEARLEKLEILSRQGISMLHGYLKGYEQPVQSPLLGDGVRRFLSLLLSISAAPNGVVLVDEIENGIHHSGLRNLWSGVANAARLFNTQVFATTHSQECIEAAHEAFKSGEKYNFRLHRLDRVEGTIKAVTYDRESLEAALSIPLEVRG